MGLRFGHLPSHEAWPLIKKHVKVQMPHRSRIRFEFNRWHMPFEDQEALQDVEMLCVSCRLVMINPIRKRRNWSTLYLRVTCEKKGCCRSLRARKEIDAIMLSLNRN